MRLTPILLNATALDVLAAAPESPHSRRCVLRLRVVEYLERAAWDIERQAPLVSSGRIFRPLGPFPPRRALSSKIYVAERGRSIEAVCAGWGHSPSYTREAPNGGLGR